MSQPEHILYCDCIHYEPLSRVKADHLLATLETMATPSTVVPDLCKLCADENERLAQWAQLSNLLIIACHPRAVRWLFQAGGVELDDSRVDFLNLRDENAIDAFLEAHGDEDSARVPTTRPTGTPDDIPWFPVIDYSRCIGCQKCQDFCLFGTFELSEDNRVEVQQPDACKTDCPACARICPENAIILPKHHSAPVNGGPTPSDDKESPQPEVNPDEFINGNIYQKLKNRDQGNRFSPNAPDILNTDNLQQKLGIPPKVMERLSPSEVERARKLVEHDREPPQGNPGEK